MTRADLDRAGVRILNRGGLANPDVLLVRSDQGPVVVKDYAPRPRLVRALVAPLLIRHELSAIERAGGLPGVPPWARRIDRLALAVGWVEGRALSRRFHGGRLPPSFFDAVEAILEGLALRGLVHLDLRSPSNVLVTPSGAPVVVDLAAAWRLPLPRGVRRRLDRWAVGKLRGRFEAGRAPALPLPPGPDSERYAGEDVVIRRVRLRRYEFGEAEDPCPVVFLSDLGLGVLAEARALLLASRYGRRAIGVDLPGVGGSSRDPVPRTPRRSALAVGRLLDALRLRRVDLVATGLGGLVGRWLASERPSRVRRLVTVDAPLVRLDEASRARIRIARTAPADLPDRLRRALPEDLPEPAREALRSQLRLICAEDLARPLRRVAVRSDDRGTRIAPRHLPSRIPVPWVALYSDPTHPGCADVRTGDARVELCATPEARDATLWEILGRPEGPSPDHSPSLGGRSLATSGSAGEPRRTIG